MVKEEMLRIISTRGRGHRLAVRSPEMWRTRKMGCTKPVAMAAAATKEEKLV